MPFGARGALALALAAVVAAAACGGALASTTADEVIIRCGNGKLEIGELCDGTQCAAIRTRHAVARCVCV